ncbi:MAG: L-threonylcarbamoyladenylate synthase [Myxococcota bacterium]|nr:L-threonylcarbamoyladenylate synthase [Myxococcota bacterium]
MTLPDPLGDAARWVSEGGLLAYPTETVWGLGADASSDESVARLRAWKGRRAADPISVLVPDIDAAEQDFEVGEAARVLAQQYWPGPLTLVVGSRRALAKGVAREDGAVGLRCSSHPLAAALARRLRRAGEGPLTATSLNRTGAPPARSANEARALCDGSRDEPRLLGVDGAEAGGDDATTVVDLSGPVPRVLRWGGLDEDALGPTLRELGAA